MNADRLLYAFSMIGEDPARIQQLRQVVVALAVAGKLGADSAFFSHCEMLDAVEQVKADLYKQRAIPKPKNHKPIEQGELPESFPDAGQFAPLGTLARVEKGLTGIKQAQPGPFPLVVTGAERASCDHFDFEGASAIIPLVSSTGHGHASLNRLHYQEGKFALGTILAAVFPYDPALVSTRFIFEYLSAFKEELLVARMTGTANVTLSVGRIVEVPVPLIDPVAQAKVDELMALCDQLEAARAEREAVRDRMAAASLARLTAPDADPAAFQAHATFTLDNLTPLTTRPDQIKPLRQTILNLAVRGKLVAQDPNDEPASELLKRIAAEKARLVKVGAIKRQKLFPEVDAHQFAPPFPWQWVTLGELGTTQTGSTPPKSKQEHYGSDVPFIRPGDLYPDRVDYSGNGLSHLGAQASGRLVPSGSVLMVCIGTVGKCQIVDRSVSFNQQINALTTFSLVDPRYILLAMQSDFFQESAWTASARTTIAILNKGNWEKLPIPLPPLEEQHRIVAKVDALMVLCDRLEAALSTADTTRQRLLEALLHEALDPAAEAVTEAAE